MTHQALRTISARLFINALERDGFVWTGGRGSHRIYRHADGRRCVVAFHRPGATFPTATLASMLEGTKWTESDLKRLNVI